MKQDIKGKGIGQLSFKPYHFEGETSIFEIVLYAFDKKDRIDFKLWYFTSLFRRETIEKMVMDFKEISKAIVENKTIKLRDVKISHGLYDQKIKIPVAEFGF